MQCSSLQKMPIGTLMFVVRRLRVRLAMTGARGSQVRHRGSHHKTEILSGGQKRWSDKSSQAQIKEHLPLPISLQTSLPAMTLQSGRQEKACFLKVVLLIYNYVYPLNTVWKKHKCLFLNSFNVALRYICSVIPLCCVCVVSVPVLGERELVHASPLKCPCKERSSSKLCNCTSCDAPIILESKKDSSKAAPKDHDLRPTHSENSSREDPAHRHDEKLEKIQMFYSEKVVSPRMHLDSKAGQRFKDLLLAIEEKTHTARHLSTMESALQTAPLPRLRHRTLKNISPRKVVWAGLKHHTGPSTGSFPFLVNGTKPPAFLSQRHQALVIKSLRHTKEKKVTRPGGGRTMGIPENTAKAQHFVPVRTSQHRDTDLNLPMLPSNFQSKEKKTEFLRLDFGWKSVERGSFRDNVNVIITISANSNCSDWKIYCMYTTYKEEHLLNLTSKIYIICTFVHWFLQSCGMLMFASLSVLQLNLCWLHRQPNEFSRDLSMDLLDQGQINQNLTKPANYCTTEVLILLEILGSNFSNVLQFTSFKPCHTPHFFTA